MKLYQNGYKERKERYKENLRKCILDAAWTLLLREGYKAISVRKIASAIEFSPTAIYLYRDKNELLVALQKEGFNILRTELNMIDHSADPLNRLKGICRSYLRFAFENPRFYELMFLRIDLPKGRKKERQSGGEKWKRDLRASGFRIGRLQAG